MRLILVVLVGSVVMQKPTPRILEVPTTKPPPKGDKVLIEPASLPKVVLNHTWECGNDEFTKEISEGEIRAKCPRIRDHVNSCCLQHDDCYDQQLGQKNCDDKFCACLEYMTKSNKECHEESSPLFCSLVRAFGDEAYKASAPNATTLSDGLVEKDDYDYESTVKNMTFVE